MNEAKPITDPHVAFARAMVALCREHGCGRFQASFSLASSRFFREGLSDHTQVQMDWTEGRHGVDDRIGLRAESRVGVSEKAPADGKERP